MPDKASEFELASTLYQHQGMHCLSSCSHRLQAYRAELIREVHELKSNAIHMERKIDQLTDENGCFSSQVINSWKL